MRCDTCAHYVLSGTEETCGDLVYRVWTHYCIADSGAYVARAVATEKAPAPLACTDHCPAERTGVGFRAELLTGGDDGADAA